MPSNAVLFAPLVAGFLFLGIFNLTRYVSQTWDGARLVFYSGAAGVLLFVLARLIVIHLLLETAPGSHVQQELIAVFPGPYTGSLAGSIILGVVTPSLLNVLIGRKRAVWLTRRQGGLLRRMLTEEVGSGRPIAFTLSDDKVYVGLVLSRPTLDAREKYFKMLPTLSGYRDENRQLHLTTSYATVLEAQERGDEILSEYQKEDLEIILPLEAVVSARLFDVRVFQELFSGSPALDAET